MNFNLVNISHTAPILQDESVRVIGQNVLVKTAVIVEVSTATAVISFLKEDIGWTKRVGKIA